MFGRGPKITGWKFGPVEIVKDGWRRWKVSEWSPLTNKYEERGFVTDLSDDGARRWARQRQKDLEFLWGIQRALNEGKLTPEEYYQVLERYREELDGCRERHVHSAKCKYHPYH